jgi:hypothetical protein
VSFQLETEERTYGEALQLLSIVFGWKSTIVEVEGSPEQRQIVRQMLACARGWLRTDGRCQARLPASGFAKCQICPLFDPEWAPESLVRPELAIGLYGPQLQEPDLNVPDYLPDEWEP